MEYARQPQSGMTLQQFLAVGYHPSKASLLSSAKYLYKELPIRLAKRVLELESLPYGLSQMQPVKRVKGWYEQSFRDLLSIPEPKSEVEEQQFTLLIENIYNRHVNVVPTLAQGVVEMKSSLGSGGDSVNECPYLVDFLNRFHTSRIGIRLLISQHVALHQPMQGFIGTIATNLSPVDVIGDAISDATTICDKTYGYAPCVEIIDLIDKNKLKNNPIYFVPNHLFHICFELLKNSMRAVVEFHGPKNYDAPSIQVIVCDDEKEFSIKICDQGGGIARSDMPRIWSYLYTTSKKSQQELLDAISNANATSNNNSSSHAHNSANNTFGSGADYSQPTNSSARDQSVPMAGFGYGLPISRLYAQFFGGELSIVSVEKYGTDAYLSMAKLSDLKMLLEH